MGRYSKKGQSSQETKDESQRIAKATQRPGQTKEQTRLIAQGIQKGIEQYKKQHKAKMREQDRNRKQAQKSKPEAAEDQQPRPIAPRQSFLPWGLLVLSWVGFGSYLLMM